MEIQGAVDLAVAELEKLHFDVPGAGDTHFEVISTFISKNVQEQAGDTAIIVAYLPRTACIVCAEISYMQSRRYVTLTLCGQLHGKGYPRDRLVIVDHESIFESETFDGDFTRQLKANDIRPIWEQVFEGVKFIRELVDANLKMFDLRFLRMPTLPIAPVHAVDYVTRSDAREFFEGKVHPRLPVSILPCKTTKRK